MAEEKQPDANNTDVGSEPQAVDLVKQANEAREKLEQLLTKAEQQSKLFAEQETRRLLGGKSSAGQVEPKKLSPEQQLKDEVNNMLERTGFKPWR